MHFVSLSQGLESFFAKYPTSVLAAVTARAHIPAKNRMHDGPQDFPFDLLWVLAQEDFKYLPRL